MQCEYTQHLTTRLPISQDGPWTGHLSLGSLPERLKPLSHLEASIVLENGNFPNHIIKTVSYLIVQFCAIFRYSIGFHENSLNLRPFGNMRSRQKNSPLLPHLHPKSIFLHDRVWQSNTASPEPLWACSEPLFSIASFPLWDYKPEWPVMHRLEPLLAPPPGSFVQCTTCATIQSHPKTTVWPLGEKIRPFVWSWRDKREAEFNCIRHLRPHCAMCPG